VIYPLISIPHVYRNCCSRVGMYDGCKIDWFFRMNFRLSGENEKIVVALWRW
jgi:hypothetical protein